MSNAFEFPPLKPAPVVLIVPPFANYAYPSLAAAILQAGVQEAGYGCTVVYASLAFARKVGRELYDRVALSDMNDLVGERIFARQAHAGLSSSAVRAGDGARQAELAVEDQAGVLSPLSDRELAELDALADAFVPAAVDSILTLEPQIVGFTSMLQQTNAAAALAREIKRRAPAVVTVLGGSNCTGEMGVEAAAQFKAFDFVFQGEADFAFPAFCREWLDHRKVPEQRLQSCGIVHEMDRVPAPIYEDYLAQTILEPMEDWLIFESSRGCWWGDKHHCTFCGLMGPELKFRRKSPEKMTAEFLELRRKYPALKRFSGADLIAPQDYARTVFEQLAEAGFDGELHYEVKANPDRKRLRAMQRGGVAGIQPGVESLSTHALELMRKGGSGPLNVSLLRNCAEIELTVTWNILVEIPGETRADYEAQLAVMPKLEHLQPPACVVPIHIHRFSPYHFDAERFGIRELRPARGYEGVFPPEADLENLAYAFEGEYEAAGRADPNLVHQLREAVRSWDEAFYSEPGPRLSVRPLGPGVWIVTDTRSCAEQSVVFLDREQYELLVRCRRPLPKAKAGGDVADGLLALGFLIELDGKLLSVVCDADVDREQEPAIAPQRPVHRWERDASGASLWMRTFQKQAEAASNGGDLGAADLFESAVAEAAPQAKEVGAAACRKGCSWCCHQDVEAAVQEAIRIARELRRLPAGELSAVRTRLAERNRATAGLSVEERARLGKPCGFLVEGRCSIYELRPTSCRGWMSTDAEACEGRLRRGEPLRQTPELNLASMLANASLLGMASAAAQSGVKAGVVDLCRAVEALLDDPDAERRWLAGEPPPAGVEYRASELMLVAALLASGEGEGKETNTDA